ncbi:hypothetical protein BRPE64_ACDS24310 [Caballeronia insecticola]|uniref:Uncharacterized protein n=1 Tax=Caballeronia insecticola TaxID=758793 RepID=R4WT86_9BURK|nr:hypothetical protein BRPE64_ACDS24310 [Caballeronia insecticola]
MFGVAADFDRLSVFNRYAQGASVGAIVRAYGSGELGWSVHRKVR